MKAPPSASRFGADKLKTQLAALLQRTWLRYVVLALAGFCVHIPALQGQLIWDDEFLARDNPFIKSPLLILETFRHHLFPDSFSAHYRPVQNISLIPDYLIWNTNAYGFHLTNILLHVGSGLLLFSLLRKLFAPFFVARTTDGDSAEPLESKTSVVCAFLVALLWIVHPVHSAAVDYISGRADSLAFLFACGAWLLVLRARAARRTACAAIFGILAALSGLLALCSREIATIWCALFILHILFFERAMRRRTKLLLISGAVSVVGLYAGLRQLPEQRPVSTPPFGWTAPTRAVLMFRALGDYGRLMVFPTKLHMERTVFDANNYRDRNNWRDSVRSEYLSIIGLAAFVALVVGATRKGEHQRVRAFGASWFFLGYLPVSNLIELNATVAEHWLYLPSVGVLIFLTGCACELPRSYRRGAVALAAVAVIGFSARSIARSSDWITPQVFYERTLASCGASTRVAVNLGQIYSNNGEFARAELLFRRVLEVTPDYPVARNNLADALYRQGKKAEAEALFASSTAAARSVNKEYPRTWIAALNLARIQQQANNHAAALATIAKARADYPSNWEIISFQSELLRSTQGPDAAIQPIEDFARAHWWHYPSALALGRLYAEKGDAARAQTCLRHASRLDVHEVDALNLIAFINVGANQLENAFEAQRRAVARQPDQPRQHALLSDILTKMGKVDEARIAAAEVTRLRGVLASGIQAN